MLTRLQVYVAHEYNYASPDWTGLVFVVGINCVDDNTIVITFERNPYNGERYNVSLAKFMQYASE